MAVHRQARASPGITRAERLQSRRHMTRPDLGIGIDKKKDIAPRDARARVAHGRDLPAIYRDDPGTELLRDASGRISRGIVDHNESRRFPLRPQRPRGGVQGFRQFVFLVMRRDNERKFRRVACRDCALEKFR